MHATAYNMPYSGPSKVLAEYGRTHPPALTPSGQHGPAKSYLRLRKDLVQKLWEYTVLIGAVYLWFFQLPFAIALKLSPHFARDYVYQAAYLVYEWTLPAVHLTQETTYSIYSFLDTLWDRGLRSAMHSHTNNVQHFKIALEAYLRLIQHKAEVIERHGLRGVPLAFSAKAA